MICGIEGKVLAVEEESSVKLDVNGIHYLLIVPRGVLTEMVCSGELIIGQNQTFVILHYIQQEHTRLTPMLIGFRTEGQKLFFEKFISVSGIGPRAAAKALSVSFFKVADAIEASDVKFLQSLPGIGKDRARRIIAQLQGKLKSVWSHLGLGEQFDACIVKNRTLLQEAVEVLTKLQYSRTEATKMVERALEKQPNIDNIEELLQVIYA